MIISDTLGDKNNARTRAVSLRPRVIFSSGLLNRV